MVMDDSMLDLVRATLVLVLKVSFPALVAGIAVGLIVSIFQSITQVQEQTLSMVPKIFAMLIVVLILLPWIAAMLVNFAVACFELVTPM